MTFVLSSFHQKKRDFYRCNQCAFHFVDPSTHLTTTEESERYRFHENDGNDVGYFNYLAGALSPLKSYFNEHKKNGLYHLDFGSGNSTATEKILKEWQITNQQSYSYDLYFSPEKLPSQFTPYEQHFDLVTAIEVVEHFRSPRTSWEELIRLLRSGGFLFVVTQIFHEELDGKAFSEWWYKNDPTHVSIYSLESLSVMAAEFGLELILTDEKKYFLWRKL